MSIEVQLRRRHLRKPRYAGKAMPLAEFLKWDAEDDEPFKYEWDNGVIVAETTFMKNTERKIIAALTRAFQKTDAHMQGGELFSETEILLPAFNKVHRPDFAFFTKEEIERSAKGEHPIPRFVAEVISESDRFSYYENKLEEYFLSGVQCVWLIVPMKRKVYVYAALKEVKICTGEDMCSAAPAIPDFQISVNQLFGE